MTVEQPTAPAGASPRIDDQRPRSAGRPRLRFSLRALLLATLVVAAFFAGRISRHDPFRPALSGSWTARLPAGFRRPTTLRFLEDDRWLLSSGASVFNGIYRYRDGKLSVVEPSDERMQGLVWRWDGRQLTLVAEPPGRPTGSSYIGTLLVPAAGGTPSSAAAARR